MGSFDFVAGAGRRGAGRLVATRGRFVASGFTFLAPVALRGEAGFATRAGFRAGADFRETAGLTLLAARAGFRAAAPALEGFFFLAFPPDIAKAP